MLFRCYAPLHAATHAVTYGTSCSHTTYYSARLQVAADAISARCHEAAMFRAQRYAI